jgi:hypothetical protein
MPILIQIDSCKECPFFDTQRTRGAGCAIDWICTQIEIDPESDIRTGDGRHENHRLIKGYIEWPSEDPKDIPEWCLWRKKIYNRDTHLRKRRK